VRSKGGKVEKENILAEEVKAKSGYTISLVIVACIILLLIGVGCYFYLNFGESRNPYINIIDLLSNEVIEVIEESEKRLNKPLQSESDVSFELNSDSPEFSEIANILNKLNLKVNMQVDMNSKTANMNLGVLYNKENMVNADLILDSTDVYANLNELYDKKIKISADGVEEICGMYDYASYKIIVEEFTNILKNNLKEEYFVSKKETIEVLGKKIKATKHSMTLNGVDIYDLEQRILSEIETKENLMKALVNVSGMTAEEIKDSLATAKEELIVDENKIIVFEIYLNRRNVEKFSVKEDEEELLSLNKLKENEFEILIKEDEEIISLGSVILNDDEIKLVIDYEELSITCEKSDTSAYLKAEAEDNVVEIKTNINDNNVNGYIRIVSTADDMDLKVNFKNGVKEIDQVDSVNVNNYIELEQMTDDDYTSIMEALYQNNAVMTLMQDVMSSSILNNTY